MTPQNRILNKINSRKIPAFRLISGNFPQESGEVTRKIKKKKTAKKRKRRGVFLLERREKKRGEDRFTGVSVGAAAAEGMEGTGSGRERRVECCRHRQIYPTRS